ncbi:hypothetical protein HRbin08_00601 [bacterium HR08]|nr:hypothetical protein HRbin08_00601 [bacterium HR08]
MREAISHIAPNDEAAFGPGKGLHILGERGERIVLQQVVLDVRDVEDRDRLAQTADIVADGPQGSRAGEITRHRDDPILLLQTLEELEALLSGEEVARSAREIGLQQELAQGGELPPRTAKVRFVSDVEPVFGEALGDVRDRAAILRRQRHAESPLDRRIDALHRHPHVVRIRWGRLHEPDQIGHRSARPLV